MELTPRAIDLIAPVDNACNDLEQLFVLPSFDPSSATRTFVIATPDQAAFQLAPRWLDAIRDAAPRVRLRFIDLSDSIHDQMAARTVDFAVMPSFFLEDMNATPLHFRPLFRDHSVALFRTGHPLGQQERMSEAGLCNYRLLSFHPGSDWIERKRTSVLLGNTTLNAIAYVPQITLLPFLLLERDDYAIISQRMAERLVTILPLAWRPLDFQTPPIDIGIAWSYLKDADPAHSWFRDVVVGLS
jgi:LysR family transcriptional regulator, nod-box dependent transcriptional activator